jgi:membrane associated rhomboid family serine protease
MSHSTPPWLPSKLNMQDWWLTTLFIAVNVGLFLWQIFSGVNVSDPSLPDAIRWGADYAPLTFLEEPIRLFTSMFFHFGLIHLMLNMWALYIFGSVAEQLFGRFYYFMLYLATGLMGSLFSGSLAIHDTVNMLNQQVIDPSLLPHVSAGASGAVMGLGGALTLLSLFPVLPQQRFILDKKTLIMVMGINLVIGLTISGINNAAHVGGMLMGAVLAGIWYLCQKSQKPALSFILGTTVAIVSCWFLYQYCLQQVQLIQPIWAELLQAMRQRYHF